MISGILRCLAFFGALVVVSCQGAQPVCGQGFLEQLEKKSREALGLNDSTGKSDEPAKSDDAKSGDAQASDKDKAELPPPSSRRTPPPQPMPSTSNGSSSILEAPSLATPSPTPAQATPQDGTYLGLEAASMTGGGIGARVTAVTDNSPAWRAGFKVNDVILAIDGFAIADLDTMIDRLALRRPGDSIKVMVLRGSRNVDLTAVLQNASVAQRIHGVNPNGRTPSPLTPPGNAWLGVMVADLSTAFRTQFGLRAYRAAAVTNVTKGSPADALSIQPGDAIVGADGRSIESARDLLDWMATRRPGDLVSLNVMRGTRSTILETTLVTDPKYQPAPAARPVAPDPFGAGSINVETSDNTVPSPAAVAAETTEVKQLRSELKAAQNQIQSLEQRLAELETMLKNK